MFLWHKSEKGAEKSQEDAFSRRVAKAIHGGSLTSIAYLLHYGIRPFISI